MIVDELVLPPLSHPGMIPTSVWDTISPHTAGRYHLSSSPGNCSLTIDSAEAGDTAVYQCNASSRVGHSLTNAVQLFVTGNKILCRLIIELSTAVHVFISFSPHNALLSQVSPPSSRAPWTRSFVRETQFCSPVVLHSQHHQQHSYTFGPKMEPETTH